MKPNGNENEMSPDHDNRARQYRAVTVAELLCHEFPAREFVLEPIFTLSSLNMLFAWRGLGKTHVALGIAYAAAAGSAFWQWNAARPFKVLLIDGEMPGESLQARVAAVAVASELEPDPDNFRILTIDLCGGVMPDLATPEGQASVAEECEWAELIVVDNLSCLVRGLERENSAESWTSVAQWALNLRSRGKCVLFVHHAGKNGQQRGTSKREDLLDVVIELKRPADYEPDQGARFVVNFDKARHLSPGKASASFEAWLQTDDTGRSVWTTKPFAETNYDRIVELANLGMSQSEIADELGINRSNVCRAFRRAKDEGRIFSQKDSGERPKARRTGKGPHPT